MHFKKFSLSAANPFNFWYIVEDWGTLKGRSLCHGHHGHASFTGEMPAAPPVLLATARRSSGCSAPSGIVRLFLIWKP
jgi:hypothetical protein